jgi:hypothetical protein
MTNVIIEEPLSVITLSMLAKKTGLHRTTLIRMEQRNVIPRAKWAGPPVNGRVYDAKDVKKVEALLKDYFAGKTDSAARDFVKAPEVQPDLT